MAQPRSVVLALALVLCGAFAAGLLPTGHAGDGKDGAPKVEETVAAKRYRTWVFVEAGRGGMWIEELFFPEQGVCANVEMRVETKGNELTFPHLLNAFPGAIRNKFTTDFHDPKQTESPVEDVRVPTSVAKAIFEAADLHRRLEQARHDVGAKVSALGLCRDLDGDGKLREPFRPTELEGGYPEQWTGKVERMGPSIEMQGTHRLVDGGKTIVILQSAKVDLSKYEGKRVSVKGPSAPTVEGKQILVDVAEIQEVP